MLPHLTRTIPLLAFLGSLFLTSIPLVGHAAPANSTETQHVRNARAYLAKGELKAAVIELKNAARKDLNNADTRLLLGRTYLQLEQGANAQKELERARKLGAEPSAVLVDLVRALILQAKYREVINGYPPSPQLDHGRLAQLHA